MGNLKDIAGGLSMMRHTIRNKTEHGNRNGQTTGMKPDPGGNVCLERILRCLPMNALCLFIATEVYYLLCSAEEFIQQTQATMATIIVRENNTLQHNMLYKKHQDNMD